PDLQINSLKQAGCVKIFIDTASGGDRERPNLSEALSFVRAGDTFVCWKLDRVARSLVHLLEVTSALDTRKVVFTSLTEHIDTSTASGRMMFHLLGAFAEFERSIIRERINAGIAARKARGLPTGRPPIHPLSVLGTLKTVTRKQQAHELGVERSTLYRYLRK